VRIGVRGLFRFLELIFVDPEKPPVLEEEHYPRDKQGRPDLGRFTRPLDHYLRYLEEYFTSLGPDGPDQAAWQSHAYLKGVFGQWGLIAKGPGEALPYVLQLLDNPLTEARSAAAAVLDAWADDGDFGPHLVDAATKEKDPETLSTLLGTIGRLRIISALPLLARVLRSPASKAGDVDWSAVEALSAIARERFDRASNPKAAADEWLQLQGL
jgi:hypothetical protein